MDFSEIVERKRPNTRSVPVLLEPDLRIDLDSLQAQLKVAVREDEKSNEADQAPPLEKEIAAVYSEIEEATAVFVFRALRRSDFNKLIADHPPTPDDEENGLDFEYESIAPELLSRSAVDPEMTLANAEEIWTEWDSAVGETLVEAAYLVNKEVRDVPFASGSYDGRPSSAKKSKPPAPTESDTPSS